LLTSTVDSARRDDVESRSPVVWRLGTWPIEDALSWITERRIVHGSLVVEGRR